MFLPKVHPLYLTGEDHCPNSYGPAGQNSWSGGCILPSRQAAGHVLIQQYRQLNSSEQCRPFAKNIPSCDPLEIRTPHWTRVYALEWAPLTHASSGKRFVTVRSRAEARTH